MAYVRLAPSVEQLLPLAGRRFGLAPGEGPSPQLRALLSVDAETMRAVFAHLGGLCGSTVDWLIANGLSPVTLDRLRTKLIA